MTVNTEFQMPLLYQMHIMDSADQRDMLALLPTRSQQEREMKMLSPIIGAWYKDLQTHALFEVVDWDPAELIIETQFLDGEVSEYDLDAWREMPLEKIAPPEDWRAPFELDDDDMLDPDLPMHPEEWASPLSSIEPETMYGVEDF